MCCDGTMYRTVDVGGDDPLDRLESAGLVLSTTENVTLFRQPCSAFDGSSCAVYKDRPGVCRQYRCLLLRRHEAGEVSRDEALALIKKTTALRDRVRPELHRIAGAARPEALEPLYRIMEARFDESPDPPASRRAHRDLLISIAALRVLLAREFEPRDSRSHKPD